MTMVTRSRPIPFLLGKGKISGSDIYKPTGQEFDRSDSANWPNIMGKQTTASEGHPWNSRSPGDTSDIGGEFFSTRSYVDGFAGHTTGTVGEDDGTYIRRRTYNGPHLPLNPSLVVFPASIASSNSQLDAAGATAIARCKPTNSVADVSVAIGELLKDGIPSLIGAATWKDRSNRVRGASDDFLNAEFGWLPLVNDVRRFAEAITNADRILAQYERDAGRVVRRRYSFPVQRQRNEVTVATGARSYIAPDDVRFQTGLPGTLTKVVETTKSQWFSGAFTYHLPTGSDSRSVMARRALEAKKLLGLTLTPETLWNLAPWSWAVDWFSNTGDVVSNLSDWATNGLVLRYGYMMEHSIVRHTYSLNRTGRIASMSTVPSISFVTETKVRRRANPFGFGLTWDGLSPVQLLIAAALGISRR